MKNYKEKFIGKKFGRLIVLSELGIVKGRFRLKLKCSCGSIVEKNLYKLTDKYKPTKSCGCLVKEIASKTHRIHGNAANSTNNLKPSKTWLAWKNMRNRCQNRHHKSFKDYGGRGIKVCKRWLGKMGFINFLSDMGEAPQEFTLERREVNGNYEPSNCRWATRIIQGANKRIKSKTMIRGVFLKNGKYEARTWNNGKQEYLGRFDCPLLASAVHQLRHIEIYGF